MALTIGSFTAAGGRILCTNPTRHPLRHHLFRVPSSFSSTSRAQAQAWTRTLLVVSAAKKVSFSTGRYDSKNRRRNTTTTDEDQQQKRTVEIGEESVGYKVENVGEIDDGYVLPDLPGLEPDFWEGPQWDGFGFFMQYMWAFGVVFALIACGVAVVTYNEGATDFKETPAYKESVQSRDLLEEPDASTSDVFESNPTEVAPSLD